MLAIVKREIASFFNSPIGYLVIAVFLIINGLFLWVFEGDYNILNAGFADLSAFFTLAPWILIFLIPAVTMRSFSEEKRTGTIELLLTSPIKMWQLIAGKYLGSLLLIILAIVPTLLYLLTLSSLKTADSTLDYGSIIGSYIGLVFLASGFTAIGLLTSALSKNQIVAFMLGVLACFAMYFGFEGIARSGLVGGDTSWIEWIGMKNHFDSMARGVIDTRDLLYFILITAFFLEWIPTQINQRTKPRKDPKRVALLLFIIVIVLFFGFTKVYKRFDLTADQRYSLSEESIDLVKDEDKPILITVFLEGEFPAEFKRLQTETEQLLQEFKAENNNITYEFVNPLEDEANPEQVQQELANLGIIPAQATVRQGGQTNQVLVYPWALAYFQDKTVKINLLKNQLGTTTQERVTNSVQNLEFAFADGLSKLVNPKAKKVAVLKGNGQLDDAYIANFFGSLREYYYIAPFTLDSVGANPQKTLADLQTFDLVVNAKPTQAFSDHEKYVLDQYTLNGGNSMWLLDAVQIENDSLFASGEALAVPRDLGLTDFFFKYGVRINANLVQDLYSAPMVLASGQENNTQYEQYPWFYSPIVVGAGNHPITTNIEAVKFEYTNQIDTLPNAINKTVLLESSQISRVIGAPHLVQLDNIEGFMQTVNQGPKPEEFPTPSVPLAVLLEGNFSSVYSNRIKPFSLPSHRDSGDQSKIIVISDGDVIKNQMQGSRPLELGFDKWTNTFYGNKEFLLNAVNFVLADDGLINIRSKEIAVAFLDPQEAIQQRTKWQALNILLPLGLLGIFGFVFGWLRKRKYAR
ncbi:MAG: gliding motility-associated ABC transporter substrate-binding protein GldG [Gilvibacter sp.]